jgi:glycerol-3-phosphate acyltransferase PlsY
MRSAFLLAGAAAVALLCFAAGYMLGSIPLAPIIVRVIQGG